MMSGKLTPSVKIAKAMHPNTMRAARAAGAYLKAVSYTHLDVYKRQVPN